MSTFRLEPEHFILTTGTFNLIVKDRIAFRLSGALSVRTDPLSGNPYVLETFQPYRVALPLSTLCNHRISTCYPQRGVSIQARKTQARRTLYDNAATLFRFTMAGLIGACRSGRRSNLKRSLGRFCFSRNPSGTFVPECGSRDPGSIIEAC